MAEINLVQYCVSVCSVPHRWVPTVLLHRPCEAEDRLENEEEIREDCLAFLLNTNRLTHKLGTKKTKPNVLCGGANLSIYMQSN